MLTDRGEGLLTQLYSLLDRIMPTTHYVSQALLHLQANGLRTFPRIIKTSLPLLAPRWRRRQRGSCKENQATRNAVASMINEGTANDVFRSLRLRKGEGGVRICSSSITQPIMFQQRNLSTTFEVAKVLQMAS
jgi:hypothetical protein